LTSPEVNTNTARESAERDLERLVKGIYPPAMEPVVSRLARDVLAAGERVVALEAAIGQALGAKSSDYGTPLIRNLQVRGILRAALAGVPVAEEEK
jgi:hypothetical protein